MSFTKLHNLSVDYIGRDTSVQYFLDEIDVGRDPGEQLGQFGVAGAGGVQDSDDLVIEDQGITTVTL